MDHCPESIGSQIISCISSSNQLHGTLLRSDSSHIGRRTTSSTSLNTNLTFYTNCLNYLCFIHAVGNYSFLQGNVYFGLHAPFRMVAITRTPYFDPQMLLENENFK